MIKSALVALCAAPLLATAAPPKPHYDIRTPVTVRPALPETFKVGTKLRVLWGGQCWNARVVRVRGAEHFITYPGWAHSWDEWVTDERIVSGDEVCPNQGDPVPPPAATADEVI